MKKFLCVLLLVVTLASTLTGCYTCSICGEDKIFGKEELLGEDVCSDCIDDLNDYLGGF